MRLAGTAAVNWVAFMNLVLSGVLFQRTVEVDEKPLPFTVRVKPGPVAVAVLGLMLAITGGTLIVNVTAFEVTPPDTTVT